MREIVLDTETTGIGAGHRVIEIGCVELVNMLPTGKHFHVYLNPERAVDPGAFRVHGLSDAFLKDKPPFRLIAGKLLKFLGNARLFAHNAPFDKGMLDAEFELLGFGQILNEWVDTLPMARKAKPGGKHNLDVLLKHYGIGSTNRKLHGALLDAQLLAEVLLHLRGGKQIGLDLAVETDAAAAEGERRHYPLGSFRRHRFTEDELASHAAFVATLPNAVWNDNTPAQDGEGAMEIAA